MRLDTDRHQPLLYIVMNSPFITHQEVDAMSSINIRSLFSFARVNIERITADPPGQVTHVDLVPDQRYSPRCGRCQASFQRVHSWHTRMIRDLPMAGSQVVLRLRYRKGDCPTCGITVEYHEFVEPYARVTSRFARYVASLCQMLPLTQVATHVHLSWDQVYRIDRAHLHRDFGHFVPSDLRLLCLDEISLKKHHHYLTVLANYETGAVVAAVEDRTATAVITVLHTWPSSVLAGIQAVAIDMWDPYIKALREVCPHAKIVFDPFHVIQAFGKVIDKIRREAVQQASATMKPLLKGSRYLLLKNAENLTAKERPRLQELLRRNELLASVYLLKDYLKRLWQYTYPAWAKKFLQYWCDLALETGSRYLQTFVKTLQKYQYGIINHCRFPIHTSKLEGINNKIKVLKRQAYGFHDVEYFTWKIMQCTTN